MPSSITGYLTGGLIDPVTPDYAGLAKTSEKQRQGLINSGFGAINSVFSGGAYTPYTLADPAAGKFDPKSSYWFLNKKGQYAPYWGPDKRPGALPNKPNQLIGMIGGGPDMGLGMLLGNWFGGGGKSPREVAEQQFKKGLLLQQGPQQQFKGFGPDFFNQAAQSYVDYQAPIFNKEFSDTQRSLDYGLMNRGLVSGTARNKAMSDLAFTSGRAQQDIANNAIGVSNDLKKQIENARQAAISSLYQSADPGQALQQSIASAAQFQVPQTFTPITNAFTGLANQYAQNYLYNPMMGNPYAAQQQSMFGQNLGSNPGALPPVAPLY